MNYIISTLEREFLTRKTKEEMKEWISKYNVKDHKGNNPDLRRANRNSSLVVRVNGKQVVITSQPKGYGI